MIGYPGGSAGATGTAGTAGMLGVDPVAVCYANGGVPSPSNASSCLFGPEATRICESHYISSRPETPQPLGIPTCASGCGCVSCAAQYDICVSNYSCVRILDCAERVNCSRMVDCYQAATCQTAIDAAGGQRSPPAISMANVLACMTNTGCTMSCVVDGTTPPGR
jgi:hypothetical protein